MPERPKIHRPMGHKTKREADKARPNAHDRGYNHKWKKARLSFLKEHPMCVHCAQQGLLELANVVDHIIPHKGDQQLFWQINNWQALCKRCHDIKTANEDGAFGR